MLAFLLNTTTVKNAGKYYQMMGLSQQKQGQGKKIRQ